MILNKFKPLAVTALVATFLFSCSQDEQRDQQIDEELVAPSSSNIVEGQYIVVFNKKVSV